MCWTWPVSSSLHSDERLRTLEGTVGPWPGIAYVEDVATGRSIVVSAASARILGYSSDVLGRATEAFWRALRPPAKKARQRTSSDVRSPEADHLRRQDGTLLPYREIRTVLARAADGQPLLVFHTFRKSKTSPKLAKLARGT